MRCKQVVGVHNGHNAAAAVVRDGQLSFALQEERLTRLKNQGGLPLQTLRAIATDFAEPDSSSRNMPIAFGGKNLTACAWQRDAILASYGNDTCGPIGKMKRLARKNPAISESINRLKFRKFQQEIENKLEGTDVQTTGFDHHLCHAAAAYLGWGRMEQDILVLTCDGAGDCVCATVNIGKNGELRRIAATEESHSLGAFFGKITYLMGMVPLEHEYKVMGLASYGETSAETEKLAAAFAELFEFDPRNPLVWRRRNGSPPMQFASAYLGELIQRKRFDHVAAAAQLFVERFLTQWVQQCVRETGIPRVALSGGVFMNVKANKRILELPEVEELFVFPSCGDETNAIGAAWLLYQHTYHEIPRPLEHLYLGTGYSYGEVQEALRDYKFQHRIAIQENADIERRVAELLSQGSIVARFKGRCEFGARALGNRSILANASRLDSVRTINEMIKCRDFWMPFAPSVLEERSGEYFQKPKPMPAPHMIMTFETREEKRAAMGAALHPYDFTGRPQEVSAKTNPDYYRLLKYVEELTGEGIVLNTSFNLHGEPIVCTPADALRVFDISGLQHLALENVLLTKS
ncbi:MAG TPA: carbamoyltransferase C-terminal domain-containing protein [Candidatus Sulfotelmatobacter sp.]|nr:carbamoyltransferase C-terminal domain-containing protein [Candidatus Sulfotelmatobacter sp.]